MSMEAVAVPGGLAVDDGSTVATRVESRAVTSLAALESALAEGLDAAWRGVVESDPLANLFQTTGWCLPWYRCYADAFDPYVIVVSSGERVVGVVPMAVDRATRELVFASNAMADYRDIVARPGFREQVVRELLRHYLEGGFARPLQIGWIDPKSDTPAIVAKICAASGLRHSVRHQPCWRWFPPAPSKPSAQKFLNWYKRNGAVSFDVIESEPEWASFREEYYRQHTLRQIQAGRQTAFNDTRKAALYEALFHSTDVKPHVTAFSVDGRMLAGHFGYVWRGTLLLGPPSIRLEDEQRSPAVILLSWIIQNAERLGLDGFDLTIGESDFKKRLGNQCVELSMIEIHPSAGSYYRERARAEASAAAKAIVGSVAGPDAWKTRVKPAAAELGFQARRAREMGLAAAVGHALGSAVRFVYDRGVERTYALTRESIAAPVAPVPAGDVNENRIEDLLLWTGASAEAERALTACARSYARRRNAGDTLHTVVAGGTLAGWCYTSPAALYDGYILPGHRGTGAAETLLRAAASGRLAQGRDDIRITVAGDDTMLQDAAAANGRLIAETTRPRLFSSARLADRIGRLWQRLTWRAIRRRIALAFHVETEERTYRLAPADAAELPDSPDISRDRWEDLELFVPTEPRHEREAILEDWRQRRARGEHVYTKIEDGRLAAYGWVVERQKTMRLDWVKQAVDLPDGSAVIYDFYTLPEYRHRDFYQRLLMHAMQDAARMPGTQWIALSILGNDTVPRWWVERFGMEFTGSYFYRRVLWLSKKWRRTDTGARSHD